MTFHAAGFRTIGAMGIPAADSPAGSVRQLHTFVTNDDAAAVETSHYFDALITGVVKVQTGDLLLASLDVDGTPTLGVYQITVSAGHVVIKTAAGSQISLTGAALQENGGAIGGTNDGNLPALAMSVAWNGSSVYPSAADASMIIATFRELATAINKNTADILAIKNAL